MITFWTLAKGSSPTSTIVSHINKSTVVTKIRAIRSQGHVWEALQDFEAKQYRAVANRLVPILLFEAEQEAGEIQLDEVDDEGKLQLDVIVNARKYVRAECTFEQRSKLYHMLYTVSSFNYQPLEFFEF